MFVEQLLHAVGAAESSQQPVCCDYSQPSWLELSYNDSSEPLSFRQMRSDTERVEIRMEIELKFGRRATNAPFLVEAQGLCRVFLGDSTVLKGL